MLEFGREGKERRGRGRGKRGEEDMGVEGGEEIPERDIDS